MVYAGRVAQPEELAAFYANYSTVDTLSEITAVRYDGLLDKFAPYRTSGTLLDVGCGAGMFPERAIGKGWNAMGTEFGDEAVRKCRARGIRVWQGPLDPSDHVPGSFDVITSFEVLEHVEHPREEIMHMAQLLRPGGLVYITTPNFRSFSRTIAKGQWNVVSYPEHLNYFDRRSLDRMLREAGLKKVWHRTTGISPGRLRTSLETGPRVTGRSAALDEQARERIESQRHLRVLKSMANGLLDLLGKGDTLKAAYIRPLQ